MHIPDGYLSPQTYLPLYGVTITILAVAARKVKKTLRSRHVPLLALGAAFSFVIMMFNVPVPGGTSGHAVGAVIVAILLGPWAACVAVSIAIIIQAFLFGDGGLTAIGANCFNMAIVMPFVGYYSYKIIAGNSSLTSARRCIAGAVAGYLALNVAAFYTAIQFGIQPLLATGADGYPALFAVPARRGHSGHDPGASSGVRLRGSAGHRPGHQLCPEKGPGTAVAAPGKQRGKGRDHQETVAGARHAGHPLPHWDHSPRCLQIEGRLGGMGRGISAKDAGVRPLRDAEDSGALAGAFSGLYGWRRRGFGNYPQSLAYIGSALIGIAAIFLFIRLWSRYFAEKEPK